ncbi:putative short-chain dehydrogenase [Sterolibacterium denitrificans]|uniref:Short-chain dehydrogenase n=1 Tax=Sterolibacterium denitrificans TaxID=157592 RepID=A0A7Z7MVF7_9PROT|nr:3-oxoacyl-ACP reductase [Sterolibacterium denitrificans]SMB27299.1 putative short-chain dehydrogenase [Sterolibacterium denitrificans]
MTDKYMQFANSTLGSKLVGLVGLPRPPVLERYRPDVKAPLIKGSIVLGSAGNGRLLEAVVGVLAAIKANVLAHGEAPDWIGAANQAGLMTGRFVPPARGGKQGERIKALVFDASRINESSQLVALHRFFHDTVRSLDRCGRVIILGRPPESCSTPRQITAQRALEGMTRSLGKEIRRGCTAQLVYVAEGAEGNIESTLRFLLSPRSAYVSAQVVRIAGNATPFPVADWLQPLAGQTALVTGVSRGIGASIAEVLARDGAKVICVDVPQAEAELAAVARKLDGIALPLDVTAADAPQKMVAAAQAQGGIDIIVHNAGITRDKTIANMKQELWDLVINVNLSAQERINDALLAAEAIKRNGRIVCVSSISGIAGNLGQTNYAVSKAGVIGMVNSMSVSPLLRERGITINAVAPGFIETQMTDAIPFTIRTAARLMNSMNQGGQPIDVAETIAWFACPASTGISGNVVRVCGQSLIGA